MAGAWRQAVRAEEVDQAVMMIGRATRHNCMRMDPTYRRLYLLHKSRIDVIYTETDRHKGWA